MGFKKVYQCLTDVFPQIDFRILKAVAIEHSKDADAAVESVLSDVLPYLEARSIVCNPLSVDNGHQKKPGGAAEDEEETLALKHRRSSEGKAFENLSQPRSVIDEGSSDIHKDTTHQEEAPIPPVDDLCAENLNVDELQCNIEREELMLLRKPQNEKCISQLKIAEALDVFSDAKVHDVNTYPTELCVKVSEVPAFDSNCVLKQGHQSSGVASGSSGQENGASDSFLVGRQSECVDLLALLSTDSNVTVHQESPQEESPIDGAGIIAINSAVEWMQGAEEGLVSELIQTVIEDCDNLQSKKVSTVALLEEIVESAKNNKTTLFSAMESVMKLMREVETKEEEAELMKREAAIGCLDIFAQVEDLKKMLARVKEANDLHAGEVYGEKAILATELKELQARLLGLSHERDNALAILHEMHQTIIKRLAVAEELRTAAELEKLEKEESARNALSEQEAVMEKVVHESKILQQEAEENTKLREFLVDRGQLVDTLQGEISVICHDVRLLKEKFDKHVPLSKSISSNQTSCILASSGLSSKSTPSDMGLELGDNSKNTKDETSPFDMVLEPGDKFPNAKETSSPSDMVSDPGDDSTSSKEASSPSFNGSFDEDTKSLNDNVEEEERIINCGTQLLDGGWELLGVA